MKIGIKYIDEETGEEKTREEEITDVVDIAAGIHHTLVLRKDGTVWASGWNNYGQCGNGNTTNQSYLSQVKGQNGVGYLNNIVQITCEETTSHALAADGTVYSWGRNVEGQLGVNYYDNGANTYPIKMQKVSNIIQITGGEYHVSMLDADGSVWSTRI